jgi:hypothetical protein
MMNIRKIIKEEIQDTDIISTEVQTLYVTGLGCTVDSLFFRQDDYFNCVKDKDIRTPNDLVHISFNDLREGELDDLIQMVQEELYAQGVEDYGDIVLKRYAIQAVEIKGNEMDWA